MEVVLIDSLHASDPSCRLHVTVLVSDCLSARLTCQSCTVTILIVAISAIKLLIDMVVFASYPPSYLSCRTRQHTRPILLAIMGVIVSSPCHPSPLSPPSSSSTSYSLLFLTLRATLAMSQKAATYLAPLPDVSNSLGALLVMSRAAPRRWIHAALDSMDAMRNNPPSGRTSVKRPAVPRGRAVGAGLAIDFDRPPRPE